MRRDPKPASEAGWVLPLAVLIGLLFLSAFVTMQIWNWYAAPVFKLPLLTWSQAFGLRLLLASLRVRPLATRDKPLFASGREELAQLMFWLLTLLLAWLAH